MSLSRISQIGPRNVENAN